MLWALQVTATQFDSVVESSKDKGVWFGSHNIGSCRQWDWASGCGLLTLMDMTYLVTYFAAEL